MNEFQRDRIFIIDLFTHIVSFVCCHVVWAGIFRIHTEFMTWKINHNTLPFLALCEKIVSFGLLRFLWQYFPGGHQSVQDVQNFEQTFLQLSELITFFILYSSAWRIFDNILHMIIRCMPSKGAHSYIWLCLNISHVYSMASEFWRSWFLCLVQVLIAFFSGKPPFVKHRDGFKITENYELKLKS